MLNFGLRFLTETPLGGQLQPPLVPTSYFHTKYDLFRSRFGGDSLIALTNDRCQTFLVADWTVLLLLI